jgi:L-ribulose-5-phosphate 3-epimerase
MTLTRRKFMAASAVSLGGGVAASRIEWLRSVMAATGARFKVGAPDWNLKQEGKVESIALAKRIGFDGVQVSLGVGDKGLPLSDPALQQRFLAESKRVDLPLASVCLEILHKNGLKSDPLGQRWVADSIPAAKALGVKVVLLPFFGKWALETPAEMDRVGDILKEIAPAAEKAGIVLGLENTISAKDNVRIMERAHSPAVLTYYDVGNSTKGGFNVVEEIRWLGKSRICEMHLKDNPHYLGEGTIDFPAVVKALADIGFSDWAELETESPTGDIPADMGRNLKYIRGLMSGEH